MVSSFENYRHLRVTREEYDEVGAGCLSKHIF